MQLAWSPSRDAHKWPVQRAPSNQYQPAELERVSSDAQPDVDTIMQACWPVLQEKLADQLLTANEASSRRLQQLKSDVSLQLKSAQDHNQLVRQKNAQAFRDQQGRQQSAFAELSGRLAGQEDVSSSLVAQQEALVKYQMDDRLLLNNSIRKLKHELTADAQRQKRNQQDELQESLRRAKATLTETVIVKQAQQQQEMSQLQALLNRQQEDWASVSEALAAFTQQQSLLQQVPEQLQETQKGLDQPHRSMTVTFEAAIKASEDRHSQQLQAEIQSLQGQQLEQQRSIQKSIRALELQQADLQKLPQQLQVAEQRLYELRQLTRTAINEAKAAADHESSAGGRATADQEDLEAALSSIAWLQSQQASFQELPRQLQETQQQLAKLRDSIPASISSGVAAAEDKQHDYVRKQLNGLKEQQFEAWNNAKQSMVDLQLQQEKLRHPPQQVQESIKNLQRLEDSLKNFVETSMTAFEARQQELVHTQIQQVQDLQSEHQQAAEEAMLSLQSDHIALEQLQHQIHEVQHQLSKSHAATQDDIQSAIAASRSQEDQQIQDLVKQQRHQQNGLEEASALLQSQQLEIQQLPQQLKDAQKQLIKLEQLMSNFQDASVTAAVDRQAEQIDQLKVMQQRQQESAEQAFTKLQTAESGRLSQELQKMQAGLQQQSEAISKDIASAVNASERSQDNKVQQVLKDSQLALQQQLETLKAAIAEMNARIPSIKLLEQQQKDAQQQISETVSHSINTAIVVAEARSFAKIQDLQSKQSLDQDVAMAAIAQLQSQLSPMQNLSQLHQETRQQLAKMSESVDDSIKSAMADVIGGYEQTLGDLHQEQLRQARLIQEAAATSPTQQAKLQDIQKQLDDLRESVSSASTADKQQQHWHSLVQALEAKQIESQKAAQASDAMLHAQQVSLRQLSQQLQGVSARIDHLHDATDASIKSAITAAEQQQQQQMQNLTESLQARRHDDLKASMDSWKSQQSDLAQLPKQLLDLERQMATLEERQADPEQLPRQEQKQLSSLQAAVTKLQEGLAEQSQPSRQQASALSSLEKSVHALQVEASTARLKLCFLSARYVDNSFIYL